MEDAGVFPLRRALEAGQDEPPAKPQDELVLLQTVDFITPILDDPRSFGQAAAANSLSDVYAMGGRPLTAMNVAAFPASALGWAGEEALSAMLQGGREKVMEAGATLVGGHTVEDAVPKFGLAVTGIARRSELLLQSEGRPGDLLFLTKPIGGGVLSTALKREGLNQATLAALTETLTTLNAAARSAAVAAGLKAATDVTGFGLLGHLTNIVLASGVGAVLRFDDVPFIPGVLEYAKRGIFPGGASRNLDFAGGRVSLVFDPGIEPWEKLLLADPMTSGGLLLAVPESRQAAFLDMRRIGRLTDRKGELKVTR